MSGWFASNISGWMFASLALSLLVGFFLASALVEPLCASGESMDFSRDRQRLLDAKDHALRALKDLEADFSMGKVSPEDFDRAKQEMSLEVAAILEALGRHEQS